jgi:hypothetical protein
MSLIASGPAAPSPTRPWPADRVEHWPIERLIDLARNRKFASISLQQESGEPQVPAWPVFVS